MTKTPEGPREVTPAIAATIGRWQNVMVPSLPNGYPMHAPTVTCPACKAVLKVKSSPPAGVTDASCPRCDGRVPLDPGYESDNTDLTEQTVAILEFVSVGIGADSTSESTDGSETLAAPPGPPRSTEFTFLAPPQQPEELGRLGPYRVLGKLGAGGMGAVFRAEDPALRRHIALKVMLPHFASNVTAKARFLREARAQAAVEHDHIIAIYQVGEEGSVPFIAMPLLKGQTLADALKANPAVPISEVVRIAREVAVGLAAAHAQSLVHRDIKPANVWLEGRGRRVKILDFGLAQGDADGDATEELMPEGSVVGTPAYMSPEQACGLGVDPRTDLWSLGVMLYQMTTGELPFRGPTTGAILNSLANHNPPPPIGKNPAVPGVLSELIMRLMAKSRTDRPTSAQAVVDELREVKVTRNAPSVGALANSTAGNPDPWETVSDTEWDANPVTTSVTPAPPRRFAIWPLTLVGSLLVLAALAVVVADIMKNKNSDTIPVLVKPPTKDIAATVPGVVKEPVKPVDDRVAAEFALGLGCTLWANNGPEVGRVADLPKVPFAVTGLVFKNPQTNDADLAHFKDCKSLAFLHMNPCPQVSDAGLINFKDCKGIVLLNIGNTRVSDVGLGYFKNCPNLRVLGLDCTSVTDIGLANFKDCKQLESLWLNNTELSDKGLKTFAGCNNLTALSLHVTNTTDAGLVNFKDCKNLKTLSLSQTRVSDAGLVNLKQLTALEQLGLKDTLVTEEGVKQLATTLPRCRIEWNGGVFEAKK